MSVINLVLSVDTSKVKVSDEKVIEAVNQVLAWGVQTAQNLAVDGGDELVQNAAAMAYKAGQTVEINDVSEDGKQTVKVLMGFDGVYLMPQGYGEAGQGLSQGSPVSLELVGGELQVGVLENIDSDERTVISLEDAKEAEIPDEVVRLASVLVGRELTVSDVFETLTLPSGKYINLPETHSMNDIGSEEHKIEMLYAAWAIARGVQPRLIATFRPQRRVGDDFVDVAGMKEKFDATEQFLGLGVTKIRTFNKNCFSGDWLSVGLDARDHHDGPFEVDVDVDRWLKANKVNESRQLTVHELNMLRAKYLG